MTTQSRPLPHLRLLIDVDQLGDLLPSEAELEAWLARPALRRAAQTHDGVETGAQAA